MNGWDRRLGVVLVVSLLSAACVTPFATAPASSSTPVAAAHPSRVRFPSNLVVSVLSFDDRTGVPELAWLRTGLPDMLVAELARIPSVVVVERARLEAVIREQALHLSGRVADESAVRVGRLAGATVLVTGSVIMANGFVRIDAQLVGVEQGTILGTAVAEGPQRAASSLARLLVAKVVELFPPADTRFLREGTVPQAASATEPGGPLSREDKLFRELAELEQAKEADPRHVPARPESAPEIGHLLGPQAPLPLLMDQTIIALGEAPQAIRPLIERLFDSAFQATVGPARSEPTPDGLMTLHIPVRLAVRPAVADTAGKIAREVGGEVRHQRDALEIHLATPTSAGRALIHALSQPRRLYLRLLATDGRTMAIYSSFRHWRLSQWLSTRDPELVRIEHGKVVTWEAVIKGLTPEQVASLSRATVSLEAVPRERATVHVELATPSLPAEPIPKAPLIWGDVPAPSTGARSRTSPHPDGGGVEEASLLALRSAIERLWDPPVTERAWGPGYLPSNERVTVVTATLGAGAPPHTVTARVVRASGDAQFDEAAVAALEQALPAWWSATDPDQALARSHSGTDPAESGEGLMVRVQFRLLKDLPALNLLGPAAALEETALTGPSQPIGP